MVVVAVVVVVMMMYSSSSSSSGIVEWWCCSRCMMRCAGRKVTTLDRDRDMTYWMNQRAQLTDLWVFCDVENNLAGDVDLEGGQRVSAAMRRESINKNIMRSRRAARERRDWRFWGGKSAAMKGEWAHDHGLFLGEKMRQ